MISFVVGMTLVPIGLTFLTAARATSAAPQHQIMRRVLDWSADLSVPPPVARSSSAFFARSRSSPSRASR